MGRAFAARSRLCVRRWARTDKIAGQLADFSGILQGDGYAAYKVLARGHGGAIQLAFCLAHARRKFVEVCNTTSSPFAREVIERLQAIYAIEAEIRGSSAQQRLAARGARTAPLMGIALGRKAWLFAGSDRGGQRAAVMFTLIHTAKLNDVDPQAWLADVPGPDRRSQDQRPGCAVAVELAPPHPYRNRHEVPTSPSRDSPAIQPGMS
jgi:hypothetical protein